MSNLNIDVNQMNWNKDGLIPAIIQDKDTNQVLMLAYMNKESLLMTIESKETWFFSRSRNELWHKGATSGNIQEVVDIQVDCDKDTLLITVRQTGVACHTGSYTCFNESAKDKSPVSTIHQLIDIIAEREKGRPEGSYTTYLFEKGLDKILKKVGEETSEVIIAAKNLDNRELTYEISDLMYHLLVLMQERKLSFQEILAELTSRQKK